MYGMIHQAARSLVLDLRGEAAWQEILSQSNLSEEHFISAQYYDDDITYGLVGTISEYLGQDAPAVLEGFGNYWLKFEIAPLIRRLCKETQKDIDTIYDLFPNGPADGACKINIDLSFLFFERLFRCCVIDFFKYAGIVYQDIYTAILRIYRCNEGLNLVFSSNITNFNFKCGMLQRR